MKNKIAFCLLLICHFANAQKTSLPIMESLFGATSTNASIGNTGLTVGISKYGELVNLRWPCSNYFDHLNYRTLYPVTWGMKAEDYNRFYNANERQGSFAGIRYTQNGQTKITWLRDQDWQQIQGYYTDESPIVLTTFINQSIGLKIVCTDVVQNDADVLCRNFAIEKIGEANLQAVELLYVSNMAPCNSKPNFDPGTDWANDQKNGFATFYDANEEVHLSFNPNDKVRKKKNLPAKNATTAELQAFIGTIDQVFPEATNDISTLNVNDVYVTIGASKKLIGQCMFEDNGRGTMPDLTTMNNAGFVYGPTMIVNSYAIDLSKKTDAVSIFFAFATNAKKAFENMRNAKALGYAKAIEKTNSFWLAKMNKANIVQTGEADMQKTLKRILINILLATNKGNGIGSSVSATQPPYTMIWPRDAAMMGYVLDCAGFHEEAENNALFFTRCQRKKDFEICYKPLAFECYKGTWFQCFYADGKPSWMYDFEVDEVGWAVWMFYTHATFLTGDAQKKYVEKIYPSMLLAANFLKDFKDPFSGLQKRAREDDLMWTDQSVLGAATTLQGLKAAISLGNIMHEDAQVMDAWRKRIEELEKAVEKYFWVKKTQQYQAAIYGNFGPRGIIIWPCKHLTVENEHIQKHADALVEQMKPFFEKADDARNKEWWYLGKATTAVAYAGKTDPAKRKMAENYLQILLKQVCTQDTRVYGETPMVRDISFKKNGVTQIERVYDNRVGQPCNIAAAWIYMTAEILYGKNEQLIMYN
jgi:hypothetical protein